MASIKPILNPRSFSEPSLERHDDRLRSARECKAKMIILHVTDKPVVRLYRREHPSFVRRIAAETLRDFVSSERNGGRIASGAPGRRRGCCRTHPGGRKRNSMRSHRESVSRPCAVERGRLVGGRNRCPARCGPDSGDGDRNGVACELRWPLLDHDRPHRPSNRVDGNSRLGSTENDENSRTKVRNVGMP